MFKFIVVNLLQIWPFVLIGLVALVLLVGAAICNGSRDERRDQEFQAEVRAYRNGQNFQVHKFND